MANTLKSQGESELCPVPNLSRPVYVYIKEGRDTELGGKLEGWQEQWIWSLEDLSSNLIWSLTI